mmetsp:Transcript_48676/g.95161  ORF Transcript_48676/g.95161 Transcript_48676/m.95161 type:complete len:309 (-) Transcript_48676:168-1094(-)
MIQVILKIVKYFIFFFPTHVPIHGQWWSNPSTQRPQSRQCCPPGGWVVLQKSHQRPVPRLARPRNRRAPPLTMPNSASSASSSSSTFSAASSSGVTVPGMTKPGSLQPVASSAVIVSAQNDNDTAALHACIVHAARVTKKELTQTNRLVNTKPQRCGPTTGPPQSPFPSAAAAKYRAGVSTWQFPSLVVHERRGWLGVWTGGGGGDGGVMAVSAAADASAAFFFLDLKRHLRGRCGVTEGAESSEGGASARMRLSIASSSSDNSVIRGEKWMCRPVFVFREVETAVFMSWSSTPPENFFIFDIPSPRY